MLEQTRKLPPNVLTIILCNLHENDESDRTFAAANDLPRHPLRNRKCCDESVPSLDHLYYPLLFVSKNWYAATVSYLYQAPWLCCSKRRRLFIRTLHSKSGRALYTPLVWTVSAGMSSFEDSHKQAYLRATAKEKPQLYDEEIGRVWRDLVTVLKKCPNVHSVACNAFLGANHHIIYCASHLPPVDCWEDLMSSHFATKVRTITFECQEDEQDMEHDLGNGPTMKSWNAKSNDWFQENFGARLTSLVSARLLLPNSYKSSRLTQRIVQGLPKTVIDLDISALNAQRSAEVARILPTHLLRLTMDFSRKALEIVAQRCAILWTLECNAESACYEPPVGIENGDLGPVFPCLKELNVQMAYSELIRWLVEPNRKTLGRVCFQLNRTMRCLDATKPVCEQEGGVEIDKRAETRYENIINFICPNIEYSCVRVLH